LLIPVLTAIEYEWRGPVDPSQRPYLGMAHIGLGKLLEREMEAGVSYKTRRPKPRTTFVKRAGQRCNLSTGQRQRRYMRARKRSRLNSNAQGAMMGARAGRAGRRRSVGAAVNRAACRSDCFPSSEYRSCLVTRSA